jgi:ethanolamine utilization cobalamin adenosyltransferase
MLYTLEAVKANIRNRDGKRVFFLGKGDQLTWEARDFLNGEKISILPAEQAKIERYRLLSGGFLEEKPEHMTHLHGDVLVLKTHPRIRFRGAMDTLEAELLLAMVEAQGQVRRQLQEVLEQARFLIRCEVMEEPVTDLPLCGMSPKELRERSHRPQDFYGQPHFMPSAEDGRLLLQVNRARCAARNAELAAMDAFLDQEGNPVRSHFLQVMNRMSSMLYLIMIQLKAEKK